MGVNAECVSGMCGLMCKVGRVGGVRGRTFFDELFEGYWCGSEGRAESGTNSDLDQGGKDR